MKTRKGFTLIELLVVIVIIGVLIGLLIPAVMGAIKKAKRGKAQGAVTALRIAWDGYFSAYGTWPDSYAGSTESIETFDDKAYDILNGDSDDNPRKIRFMDFPANTSVSKDFRDVWGREFRFSLDLDYDGKVPIPGGTIRRPFAVWSLGLDGKEGTKDDIVSWK